MGECGSEDIVFRGGGMRVREHRKNTQGDLRRRRKSLEDRQSGEHPQWVGWRCINIHSSGSIKEAVWSGFS